MRRRRWHVCIVYIFSAALRHRHKPKESKCPFFLFRFLSYFRTKVRTSTERKMDTKNVKQYARDTLHIHTPTRNEAIFFLIVAVPTTDGPSCTHGGHCPSLTLAEAAAKDLFISDNSRCAPDDASFRLCALVHVLIHSLLC